MARPTDNIEWATDGSAEITEPSGAYKLLGLLSGTPFVGHYYNWMLRAFWRWIDYLDTDIEDGRDPEKGYVYDGGLEFKWNFSPIDGHFTELGTAGVTAAGGVTINSGGTPVFLQPSAAGAIPASVIVIPFAPRVAINFSAVVPTVYELTNIRARVKGTVASTITVKLKHAPISGGAGVTTDVTFSPTIAAGFADRDDAVSVTLDFQANTYWWEVTIGMTSGSASDTGITTLIATLTKDRVE